MPGVTESDVEVHISQTFKDAPRQLREKKQTNNVNAFNFKQA